MWFLFIKRVRAIDERDNLHQGNDGEIEFQTGFTMFVNDQC